MSGLTEDLRNSDVAAGTPAMVMRRQAADEIEKQAAFLAEARDLSGKIQHLSMAGMHGDRLLQVNKLWNELHELIELGETEQ